MTLVSLLIQTYGLVEAAVVENSLATFLDNMIFLSLCFFFRLFLNYLSL